MWSRIRNVWRPECFHYHHRLASEGGYFEGWYFKLVDAKGEQPYALIPGIFLGSDKHAFIQILDGRAGTATYHRFPVEDFEAAHGVLDVRIGHSRFRSDGIELDIPGSESDGRPSVRAEIHLDAQQPWPVTLTSPGVMGPYSFVPFMECNHGILSLDHGISGRIQVGAQTTHLDGGRGYTEKDWGRSFPSGYVWVQSNHFERTGISLTASVARIPWLTGAFRGFLVGLLLDGELHRFMTYTGAEIEALELTDSLLSLRIRNRRHRLELEARKLDGGVLHAPYEQQMIERVAETMSSEVSVRLSDLSSDAELFAGRGRNACLEAQGDLAAVLDA